ncbi:methylglyoxal synthase [Clostridium sp. DL1XJH146]
MNIALVAHDGRKKELIEFVVRYKSVFENYKLFATGTTGKLLTEETGLEIHRFKSGPLGGDQQIGALVATGNMDMIFFLRDPLTAQPHEPDVSALLRICDVHHVPLATNIGSAEVFVKALMTKRY